MAQLLIDIDTDFTEGKSKDILLRGREAINNWILNLFTTSSQFDDYTGDRPYEPSYGSNLERFLYEPVDVFTASDIKDSIYDAITTFIPELYVNRNSISVVADGGNACFHITIVYLYRGDPGNLQFTVKSQN